MNSKFTIRNSKLALAAFLLCAGVLDSPAFTTNAPDPRPLPGISTNSGATVVYKTNGLAPGVGLVFDGTNWVVGTAIGGTNTFTPAVSNATMAATLAQSQGVVNSLATLKANNGSDFANARAVGSNVAVMVMSDSNDHDVDFTNATPRFRGQIIIQPSLFPVTGDAILNVAAGAAKGLLVQGLTIPARMRWGLPSAMSTNYTAEHYIYINGNTWFLTNKVAGAAADNVLRLYNGAIDHYSAIAFEGIIGTNTSTWTPIYGERSAIGYGNPETPIYPRINYWEDYGNASGLFLVANGRKMGGMTPGSHAFVWYSNDSNTNAFLSLYPNVNGGMLYMTNGGVALATNGSIVVTLVPNEVNFNVPSNPGIARFARYMNSGGNTSPGAEAVTFGLLNGGTGFFQNNNISGWGYGGTNWLAGDNNTLTNWHNFHSRGSISTTATNITIVSVDNPNIAVRIHCSSNGVISGQIVSP